MHISYLQSLMSYAQKNSEKELKPDFDEIKIACDFLDSTNFKNFVILNSAMESIGTLFARDINRVERSGYLECIKNIVNQATQDPSILEGIGNLMLRVANAYRVENAQIITEIAVAKMLGQPKGMIADHILDLDNFELVEQLSQAIEIAKSNKQISTILRYYEEDPKLINSSTIYVFTGKNLNGSAFAVNIFQAMREQKEEIPYKELEVIANADEEYISLADALEENIAIEGLMELRFTFPTIDLPVDQYYVKRLKEQVCDCDVTHNKTR